MIITILRLGIRLALSFDVRQRWRQICFAGAAMVLVMTLAGTIAEPSRWRYLPLIISLGFMAASRILGESIGFALVVTSLVLGLASLPWTMPALIASLGDWFASSASPARWLAGKRLRYSAAALGRPAIALGAMVFTGGALFGIYQRLSIHPESQESVASAYVLAWRDLAPSDLSDFAGRLPGAVVAGRAFDGDRSTLAIFSSCEDFIRAMSYSAAGSCADGLIDLTVASQFESAYRLTPVIGAREQASGGIGEALVFLAAPGAAESIWKATNGYLPAVNLLSVGGASAAPPLARDWLVAAGALAATVLTLALLQSYANGALSLSSDDRRLDRLLIERGHIARVNRWTLVGPSIVATFVGCLLAITFAWAANDVELAIPATGGILILSSVCLGLNLALASIVAVLQSRWAVAPDRPAAGEPVS